VQALRPTADRRWEISVADHGIVDADAVIVALPSDRAAQVLATTDEHLASLLASIQHSSCVIVCVGYRRQQIGHPLNGFGFVVPLVERRRILSASFSSVKYAGRAPDGHELIRVFIGGACQSELVELSDEQLLALVADELGALMSVSGDPILHYICRWNNVMPQYRVGHRQLVQQIEQRCAQWPGLALAGNAYDGVGIPNCIHRGQLAAQSIFEA
jgi:oxygen-dependent protoporphyrinogen oxidase